MIKANRRSLSLKFNFRINVVEMLVESKFEMLCAGKERWVDVTRDEGTVDVTGRAGKVDVTGRAGKVDVTGNDGKVDVTGRAGKVDVTGGVCSDN